MKRFIFFPLALLLALSACTNNGDDDNNVTPGTKPGGTWQITYFFDKDHEETGDFSGYTFEFADNGVFIATNSGGTTTGTWSLDDSSNKLVIGIAAPKPLEELNDDWLIQEMTGSSIKLKDDNDEHLEELHFAKL